MDDTEVIEALEKIFSADSESTSGAASSAGRLRRAAGADPHRPRERLDAARKPVHLRRDGHDHPRGAAAARGGAREGDPRRLHHDRLRGHRRARPDMGLWHHKIPVEVLQLGTDAVAIDERIAPEPGEQSSSRSTRAPSRDAARELCSAPPGRHGHRHRRDHGRLRPPHGRGRDRYGFRPIVVRECVGDRVAGRRRVEPVRHRREVRRVESLETVLDYLDGISFGRRAGIPAIASA